MLVDAIGPLALLAAAALLFGLGHASGTHQANQAAELRVHQLREQQRSELDAALAKARREGDAAAQALRTELDRAGQHQAQLQQRLRHVQITVAPRKPAACAPAAATAAASAAASASAPLAAAPPDPGTAGAGDAPDADAAGPGLTLAAVSLWNSALAGVDVPAGACRAADPADPACAAAAGTPLAAAWANHAANAALCAADRARHRALIALLCTRQWQPGCPPTPTLLETPR